MNENDLISFAIYTGCLALLCVGVVIYSCYYLDDDDPEIVYPNV